MDNMTEAMNDELRQCVHSFKYFYDKYAVNDSCRDPDLYKMLPFHERLWKAYNDNRYVISTKWHGSNITAVTAAWALYQCLFKQDFKVLWVDVNDRCAIAIKRDIINPIIAKLPDYFTKNDIKKDSDHELKLSHGSSMMFRAHEACCSTAANALILNDPAFVKDMSMWWKALWPMVSAGSQAIAISTTNGMNNWFYNTYHSSLEGELAWKVFKSSYMEAHPKILQRLMNMKYDLDEKTWCREVLQEFVD